MRARLILAVCLLTVTAGCESSSTEPSQRQTIDSLRLEKTQLGGQIESLKAENQQLTRQIKTLSGIEPELSFKNLHELQNIKIHKYTNLYDKDNDGRYEKLIVYIQPIDEQGDVVKAASSVDVQLWDLNKDAANAKL